MTTKTEKLDSNMQTKEAGAGLRWCDIRELGVEGRGWDDCQNFYDRLPAYAQGKVPDPVWELSKRSAGMACRFITDSPTIAARWKLRFENTAMWHMPSTGVSGIDLYAKLNGKWRWAGISRNIEYPLSSSNLAEGLEPKKREYIIYLPLYNGVEKVEIGVEQSAILEPVAQAKRRRPILFYGTSILQGASASRPGMAHANILGRRLEREIINLGFSGNGKMEIELAHLLAELDVAAYVIDCLPNMTDGLVAQRLVPFANYLRSKRPDTPIIFVDTLIYMDAPVKLHRAQRCQNSNRAQQEAIAQLKQNGMSGIYHISGDNLVGTDGECAVDGTHLTDLGFVRMADSLEPMLRSTLI